MSYLTISRRFSAVAVLSWGLLTGAADAATYFGLVAVGPIGAASTEQSATTDTPATYTLAAGGVLASSITDSANGGSALAKISGRDGGGSAQAIVRYQIGIVGPDSDSLVGVRVTANGSISGSGTNLSSGEALYSGRASFVLGTPTLVRSIITTADGAPVGARAFALDTIAYMRPNFLYNVELYAEAAAGSPFGYLTSSTAQAFVDPVYTVLPAFASRYTLRGVPFALPPAGDGGSAVPEPTSWAMMSLGFGVAGYAVRRRKVKSALFRT